MASRAGFFVVLLRRLVSIDPSVENVYNYSSVNSPYQLLRTDHPHPFSGRVTEVENDRWINVRSEPLSPHDTIAFQGRMRHVELDYSEESVEH